jgi:hypothetical protein
LAAEPYIIIPELFLTLDSDAIPYDIFVLLTCESWFSYFLTSSSSSEDDDDGDADLFMLIILLLICIFRASIFDLLSGAAHFADIIAIPYLGGLYGAAHIIAIFGAAIPLDYYFIQLLYAANYCANPI